MMGNYHVVFGNDRLLKKYLAAQFHYKRAAFAAQIGVPIIMHEGVRNYYLEKSENKFL